MITIHVNRKEGCEDLPLPRYQTRDAAGLDLYAAVESSVILEPGAFKLIPTGLHVAIPAGYEAQVRPRSGLSLKHGIGILNTPGTIDADYRGEIGVILFNFSEKAFAINRRDRIAQMVINKIEQAELIEVDTLEKSQRDTGGFGSTGF